jgi:sigma-B regulation protein RsbU (phosphoserine phosphatase)
MSSVSHELRTPLTSIRSFAEILLKEEGLDAKTQHEFLNIIHEESERLSRLINDILDTAKLRSGKVQWKKQFIDLGATIRRAVNAAQGVALEKEVTLAEDVAADLPLIWADPDRIVQVLTNLISNAVKFSPQKASVQVKAELQDDRVRVSVADQGEGVPPEQAERIFERFVQTGDVLTEKPSGTGLGLTISRDIILAHQGEIWVKPNYPVGSVFQFALPLGKPDENESKADASEPEITASEGEAASPAESPTCETVVTGEAS